MLCGADDNSSPSTSLKQAGRELGQEGAVALGVWGGVRIQARARRESLFLSLAEQIILYNSWHPCTGRNGGACLEQSLSWCTSTGAMGPVQRQRDQHAAGETGLRSEFQMRTKERRFVSHEKREVMLWEIKALSQQNVVPSCFAEKEPVWVPPVWWLSKCDLTS